MISLASLPCLLARVLFLLYSKQATTGVVRSLTWLCGLSICSVLHILYLKLMLKLKLIVTC